jgi:DNA repair protein RadC
MAAVPAHIRASRKPVDVSEGVLRIRELECRYISIPADVSNNPPMTRPEHLHGVILATWNPDLDPQEHFRVIYLDNRLRVIGVRDLFTGTVNTATVSAREPVREALMLSAASIAVTHNHPSGDPTPSAEDIAMTANLIAALKLFGMALTDHIITGRNGEFVSMKGKGLA